MTPCDLGLRLHIDQGLQPEALTAANDPKLLDDQENKSRGPYVCSDAQHGQKQAAIWLMHDFVAPGSIKRHPCGSDQQIATPRGDPLVFILLMLLMLRVHRGPKRRSWSNLCLQCRAALSQLLRARNVRCRLQRSLTHVWLETCCQVIQTFSKMHGSLRKVSHLRQLDYDDVIPYIHCYGIDLPIKLRRAVSAAKNTVDTVA